MDFTRTKWENVGVPLRSDYMDRREAQVLCVIQVCQLQVMRVAVDVCKITTMAMTTMLTYLHSLVKPFQAREEDRVERRVGNATS